MNFGDDVVVSVPGYHGLELGAKAQILDKLYGGNAFLIRAEQDGFTQIRYISAQHVEPAPSPAVALAADYAPAHRGDVVLVVDYAGERGEMSCPSNVYNGCIGVVQADSHAASVYQRVLLPHLEAGEYRVTVELLHCSEYTVVQIP